MEVWRDGVEVGVDSVKSGDEVFPDFPHAVLVGGSFSRQSRSGLCLRRAESSEEIISGLGFASFQGIDCGYKRSK